MLCVGSLWAEATQARTPRAPRAASTPSTAQILAPSDAAVPDALPPDKLVYRCGNSYSAQPCAGAGSKPLLVDDPRSQAQQRQSEDLAARDKRLASWFEAGRRERDAVASAPKPGRVNGAARDCVETAAITCQPKKPRPRHAVAKASGAAKGR